LVHDLDAILRVPGYPEPAGWYRDRGYDMGTNVVFNFQGMNSASLAGRYETPIPPRFLAPMDCSSSRKNWVVLVSEEKKLK
jgi:hypothetical protein